MTMRNKKTVKEYETRIPERPTQTEFYFIVTIPGAGP